MELHVPNPDTMDYYQFIWMYDRLNKYKLERKNNKTTSLMDMING